MRPQPALSQEWVGSGKGRSRVLMVRQSQPASDPQLGRAVLTSHGKIDSLFGLSAGRLPLGTGLVLSGALPLSQSLACCPVKSFAVMATQPVRPNQDRGVKEFIGVHKQQVRHANPHRGERGRRSVRMLV